MELDGWSGVTVYIWEYALMVLRFYDLVGLALGWEEGVGRCVVVDLVRRVEGGGM